MNKPLAIEYTKSAVKILGLAIVLVLATLGAEDVLRMIAKRPIDTQATTPYHADIYLQSDYNPNGVGELE